MRLVKVYGQLAKRLGQRVFRADVASPAEAVRFLGVHFPGLDQWLIDSDQDGIGYRVKVSKTTVGEEDFGLSCNPDATISITPVLTGAGGNGAAIGQIIAGVALVAFSLLLPGVGAAIGGALMTKIGLVGGALILGGTAQLIAPKAPAIGAPSGQGQGQSPINDPRALQSYNFNGIQNTSTQGVPIPLVYGKVFVGSVAISAGVFNTSKI